MEEEQPNILDLAETARILCEINHPDAAALVVERIKLLLKQ